MENSSESKVANGTSVPGVDPAPASDPATKPVNPLRLARPLEKSPAGLSKTSFPSGRPMPMPTINPLCPPGSNQGGKNGLKSPPGSNSKSDTAEEGKENTSAESSADLETEKEKVAETKIESKVPSETEEPQSATEKSPPEVAENPETKADSDKPAETPKEEKESPTPAPAPAPDSAPAPKNPEETKDDSKQGKDVSKSENKTESPKEVSEPDKKISEPAVTESPAPPKESGKKKKIAGPKIPVAEKTPRQPKRKQSQEAEPVGDEEKRTSKRSRAPREVYMSPDPEMAHILKTIKKQEEEEKKSTVKNGNSDEEKEKASDSKKSKTKETKKPAPKSLKTPKNRKKKKVAESESEEEEESEEESGELEEEDESEDDDDYKPVAIKKTPPRKPIRKSKVNNGPDTQKKKSGKKDPVFFKDEYLAIRNDEGAFYLCKAMQNIYIGSRNITIQWFSNEEHIIPAKDNPKQDIFAPDFYDKTEFETILTSVELDKVLGKSKRMILPEEELARVTKILQRSNDKAEGKLDMANIQLSEDNPDGLDISLYKGEDQLDEIEKRRSEKEKTPKRKGNVSKDEDSSVVLSDSKKGRGRPKKEAAPAGETQPEQTAADAGGRREKRKASKNMNYDQFDFLEEDDDEVMPAPKKRKSQDSVTSPEEKKKEEKKEKKSEEKEEPLSTSERAIIQAEKDKTESGDNPTSNTANQPVKKRGRKPKAKDE